MGEDLSKLINVIGKAKLFAILIFFLFVGTLIYYNFEGIQTVINVNVTGTQKEQQSENNGPVITIEQETKSTTFLSVQDVQITPVRFELANHLYFRVTANNDKGLGKVNISIDLGASRAVGRETRQDEYCQFEGDLKKSLQVLSCVGLSKDAFVDVLFVLTEPIFNEIVVSEQNSQFDKTLSYKSIDRTNSSSSGVSFFGFLQFLLGAVLVAITGICLIRFGIWMLNR